MDLSLELRQQQKLVMTMQMHQAFQLLQLQGLELEEALLEEVKENPALELVEQDRSLSEAEMQRQAEYERDQAADREAQNGTDENDFDWEAILENSVSGRSTRRGTIHAELPPVEHNLTYDTTLRDQLWEQFRLELSTDGERAAGEFILGCLDSNGYLDCSYEEVMRHTQTELDDVEGAILIIRELDPIGCGARDIIECLVFQAEIEYPEDPFFSDIIRNHLKDLERKDYDKIGAAMDMDSEDAEEYHKMLLDFNPRPGNAFENVVEKGITPDVKIIQVGDEWQVISNDDGIPRIQLSPMVQQLIRDKTLKGKDKSFAEEHLRKAKFFIESLLRREQTLVRVTKAILNRQLEYFEFGEEFLRPLVLRQIAEDIGVHESTVSRSTANKYVELPTGVVELKWLFCSGVKGLYGEEYAAQAIQHKIKRFIRNENQKKPLSDQAITDLLGQEGVVIARRTVAKYRESINVASSRDRKRAYLAES